MSNVRRRIWIMGAMTLGLCGPIWANGGPFVVKYPGGDPAAKGVLARMDPDLKPGREERLRVVREDLKITFGADPLEAPGVLLRPEGTPAPLAAPLDGRPPLALVSAAYTIENPTDSQVEVDFGFPILRGIYMHPYSMMPQPEVRIQFGEEQVHPNLISNSILYGRIRQRSQDVIDKALAADPELARLVSQLRAASYVRQRARETVARLARGREGLESAARADPALAPLLAGEVDARDPDRQATRAALMDCLTGPKKWDREAAVLMVEYASLDLGETFGHPPDARPMGFWGSNLGEMSRLAYMNLGRLSAIGEQKATQLFANLASRFDPSVKTAYEAIFTAWGGDVRERCLDLKTGQLRPRELTINPKADANTLREAGFSDPTLYARVEYLDPHAGLTEAEKASCQAVLKHLPVVFTFAPMNLLHYQVKFPPRSTKTLTVSYRQYAYADTGEPASYQLAYVVHPASLWEDFGPIELELAVPEGVAVRASVSCREAGVEERDLPTSPAAPRSNAEKMKMAIHRATVTDKTGELYVAVDAGSWRRTAGKKPEIALRPPTRQPLPAPVVKGPVGERP